MSLLFPSASPHVGRAPAVPTPCRNPSPTRRSHAPAEARRHALASLVAAAALSAAVSGCGTVPEAANDPQTGRKNDTHLAAAGGAARSVPWAALPGTPANPRSGLLLTVALADAPLATDDFFLTTRRFDVAAFNPLRFTPTATDRAQATAEPAIVEQSTAAPSTEALATADTVAHAKANPNAWPADGAAILAAMSGDRLFKRPDLFTSCPASPASAKGMAHALRDQGAAQAVLADLVPTAGAPANVASLGALFQLRSTNGGDFAGRLAMNRSAPTPTTPPTPAATPAQASRLVAGIFSLDAISGLDEGNAARRLPAALRSLASRFVSLGVRNKNPGNLRDPNTGGFAQFDTIQDGIRAADRNLLGYGTRHGIHTIDGVVNRWAPKGDGDNEPSAYAAAVAKSTGIAVDQPIDLTDTAVRAKVLGAMFDVESPGWRDAALREAGPVMASALGARKAGRRGAPSVRTEARAQFGAQG